MSYWEKLIQYILNIVVKPTKDEILWQRAASGDNTLFTHFTRADFNTNQNIFSALSYKDPKVKRLVWSIKYRGNSDAVAVASTILYDMLLEELSDILLFQGDTTCIIVPIPLSRKRERTRGFNQAALLAHALAREDDSRSLMVVANALYKKRETPPQTTLKNKIERTDNIRGAFAVKNPEKIRGKIVILVDDVITTGATIIEARNVLKKTGAKHIYAITLAH